MSDSPELMAHIAPGTPDFEAAYRVYEHSFPANERQSRATIENRLRQGTYQLYGAVADGQMAAIAILYPLKESDFVLLDYLAVDEKFRNRQLGSRLLGQIISAHCAGKHLIIEVENPAFGDEPEQRQKRIRFYQKQGAKRVEGVCYLLPPLSGNEPTEMLLMLLPAVPMEKIEGETLKMLIRRLYREVYNRGEEDVWLNSFIHQIGEKVRITN